MINQTYQVSKLNADGTEKKLFKVFAYKIEGDTIYTVKIINGKKSAKAMNYLVREFETSIRLGSVKAI